MRTVLLSICVAHPCRMISICLPLDALWSIICLQTFRCIHEWGGIHRCSGNRQSSPHGPAGRLATSPNNTIHRQASHGRI
ncbi:uncharacterized protein MYCGRDRAFT_105689 [Zymoseptoria tritici IPO323]|uniref:Secreted protein n=1 Tax=Zymoseptoria tritici (strain CBS 115943 / IPO323) TaxID=336722 RepID=F9XJH2_ZYMTI|nr:uncharacterized protein MYCGRDRAFT_105689 [Zymoseptoria tritici IPO323]EGP84746.1 hypothetical protein MYCGRDRAFT_105689 [Zymoseptoria tritici IPO323]